MRVIIKTEVRKMIFGHAVIAWIFFLIFYYCKILNFGLLKVRFRRKKLKDVKDDGNSNLSEPFLFRPALISMVLLFGLEVTGKGPIYFSDNPFTSC